jgi:hypothetical protein
MTLLDEVTLAVLEGRGVDARASWHELVRRYPAVAFLPEPESTWPMARALAASLAELLAARSDQPPPPWCARVPAATEVRFLTTTRTEWKRDQLRKTTPEPLRRRNFFAPEGFLRFA